MQQEPEHVLYSVNATTQAAPDTTAPTVTITTPTGAISFRHQYQPIESPEGRRLTPWCRRSPGQ